MAGPIAEELTRNGIELIVGSGLKSLRANDEQLVTAVETEDGRLLPADMVMLSIGVRPEYQAGAGCRDQDRSQRRDRGRCDAADE